MPNEDLLAHIRTELERGVDKTTLIQSLLAVGWKVEDINVAMARVAPPVVQNTPPVPYPPTTSAHVAYSTSTSGSMKAVVQNAAASIFIGCVTLLTIVSIMGVWSIFDREVISKSFETLGLLAFVAIVVIVASKFVGDPTVETVPIPRPGYRAMRNITLATLIGSASLLALLGVLSIWEVIADKEILSKSMSSLAIIAFSSFIIVLICLEREDNPFWKKHSTGISGGGIIGFIILIWLLSSFARILF